MKLILEKEIGREEVSWVHIVNHDPFSLSLLHYGRNTFSSMLRCPAIISCCHSNAMPARVYNYCVLMRSFCNYVALSAVTTRSQTALLEDNTEIKTFGQGSYLTFLPYFLHSFFFPPFILSYFISSYLIFFHLISFNTFFFFILLVFCIFFPFFCLPLIFRSFRPRSLFHTFFIRCLSFSFFYILVPFTQSPFLFVFLLSCSLYFLSFCPFIHPYSFSSLLFLHDNWYALTPFIEPYLLYITFAFREMLFIIRHWNRDVC